jgi:hypothetical protein
MIAEPLRQAKAESLGVESDRTIPQADATVSRWLAKGKFLEEGVRIRNLHPAPSELSEWVDQADPADSPRNWA